MAIKMVVECVTIVLIILLVSAIFLRARRKDYAFTTFPLLILPLMHILSLLFAPPLARSFSQEVSGVIVAIDAAALVVSCIVLGVVSNTIPMKKSRNIYLIVCGVFVVILTWVLIADVLASV